MKTLTASDIALNVNQRARSCLALLALSCVFNAELRLENEVCK